MYFQIILFLFSQTCVVSEINVRCTADSSQTVINCNFIEKGLYKISEIPEGVNKVIFDRLTNSEVELSRQIKFLTISSSAFDNYEPCQHIFASGDVWVMVEDTGTLTACREVQLSPSTTVSSQQAHLTDTTSMSQQTQLPDTPSRSQQVQLPDTTSRSQQAQLPYTTSRSQQAQLPDATSRSQQEQLPDATRFIWIAIIPTIIVIIAFICFIINMIRRWIRRRRLSAESRSDVIFEMSTSKID